MDRKREILLKLVEIAVQGMVAEQAGDKAKEVRLSEEAVALLQEYQTVTNSGPMRENSDKFVAMFQKKAAELRKEAH